MIPENFLFFGNFLSKKFGWYSNLLYLCTRFRAKNEARGENESSLKDLHRQK